MYLEKKGVKADYKKVQLYAKNAIKGYGSGLLGGTLILGRGLKNSCKNPQNLAMKKQAL
uniref:Uncharacterized protein n=1 Tax=Helicobacter pylori TaxID=210 RepID=D3XNS7_HELPX|nr:hypothetical protein HPV225_0514 [Helicobacter pylori]